MIAHNPKEWFTFIFRFHKSDTIRKLFPFIILLCLYSWGVAYLEKDYFKLSEKSYVKNIPIMHNILGFAISMLLVFRTNTAYDRWWEARKLWGSLVNNSRNLALKLAVMLPEADKSFFKKVIPAYAYALRNHLLAEKTRIELFENEDNKHLFNDIDGQKHIPNQVALLMYRKLQDLYSTGKINGDQLIVLNAEMQSFTDICGA